MIAKRYDRTAAALLLIPATVYLLYLGWSNWGPMVRDVTAWLETQGVLTRQGRGQMRAILGDFRLLIEILVAFLAASTVDWLLRKLPETKAPDADHS